MIGKILIHIRLHVPEVFFLNIQSTFRLNEGLLIFSQMVPLLIGSGDSINRYPYLLIGVGNPINRGTFFVKLYF